MEPNERHTANELREAYLAEVADYLRPGMSPLRLYECVEEMRMHLNAMTFAYEELGEDPFSAMQNSLAKFGPSELIGKMFSDVSHSPIRQTSISMELGRTFGATWAVSMLLFVLFDNWGVHAGKWTNYGEPWLTATITGVPSLVLATIAWFSKRVHPLSLGAWPAFWLNVVLGLTYYPLFAQNDRPDALVSVAVGLTFVIFSTGFVASLVAMRLKSIGPKNSKQVTP